MSCLFCDEVAAGVFPVFYQDELFVARWDQFPVTPGHVEVVPRRHIARFAELTDQEKTQFLQVVAKVYELIEAADITEINNQLLAKPVNETARDLLECTAKSLTERPGQPDGYNHGLNDGEAAGQTVMHLHYHIMPRWKGDVDDPRGGIRHLMPVGGNYRK